MEGSCPGYETWLRLSLSDEVAVVLLSNATDAPVGARAKGILDLVLKGLRLPVPSQGAGSPDLPTYAGHYSSAPWVSEEVIVPWGAGLAILDLPNIDPAESMERVAVRRHRHVPRRARR